MTDALYPLSVVQVVPQRKTYIQNSSLVKLHYYYQQNVLNSIKERFSPRVLNDHILYYTQLYYGKCRIQHIQSWTHTKD